MIAQASLAKDAEIDENMLFESLAMEAIRMIRKQGRAKRSEKRA